ncbi:hypothetical protein LWT19_22320, partial [Enterobacter hormaechei]|nr:hypothetical protein [Enterobacter hormaechei]
MRAITGKRYDVVRFAVWRLRLTRPTGVRFAGWRLRHTRPTGCAFRRVAATPYPAYGMCVLPGGGYALPGLRIVGFAGWRLRLTRPTDWGF